MDDLLNYSLQANPMASFLDWHKNALAVEQNADAMSVSTFDHLKNRPSSRYLLFKGVVEDKIIFYTNYLSPKAQELSSNPEIALNFYWHVLKRQVRIHGKTTKMKRSESEHYFHSRDRESQIASYLSHQSASIPDKATLLLKFEETSKLFEGKQIPLPEYWGGILVEPYEYEFFLYGENRLNDRFLYELKNQHWAVTRLQP